MVKRTARQLKLNVALNRLRNAYLLSRGHLISFLKPYWKSDEIGAGLKWSESEQKDSSTKCEHLEARFLDHTGMDGFAVATSSGRTALRLALRALRQKKPGSNQVVLPAYSCHGLLEPILQCGLTPVFADIDSDLNVTENTVVPHLSGKTLAVIVVHLGGRYATETAAISQLAEQHGAVVIEDSCQALGGRSKNQYWGTEGPMAIYSFGLGKNLMATAGGMLVARVAVDFIRQQKPKLESERAADVLTRFSYFMNAFFRTGIRTIYPVPDMPESAFDSSYRDNRISTLDADLVVHQLRRMEEIINARRTNGSELLDKLHGVPGISVPGWRGPNVWTKFTVLVDSGRGAMQIRRTLAKAGIETEPMYVPLHHLSDGKHYAKGPLPMTEAIYERAFNLPVRPSLRPEQVDYVAKVTRRALSQVSPTRP